MKKDCAFQFATYNGLIIEDTDLITRDDADELWEKHMPKFIELLECGDGPEMVIWTDMETPSGYNKHETHLHYDDCILRDGRLFQALN